MIFRATLKAVSEQHTNPPLQFLTELVEWGKAAPLDIFASNANPHDAYAMMVPYLGPWKDIKHRRAAMLELMRVHAGFESDWKWNEGVDELNQNSIEHIEGQETGIFQVSFNSTQNWNRAMEPFALQNNINTPEKFILNMKANHQLAFGYYARLVRVAINWAGPLITEHKVPAHLNRAAMEEFQFLLDE